MSFSISDPTEAVLIAVFATALGVFVCGVLLQAVRKRKGKALVLVPEDPYRLGEALPLMPEIPVGKVYVWFYKPVDLVGAAAIFALFLCMALAVTDVPKDPLEALKPSVLLVNIGFQFVLAGIVALVAVRRVSLVTWLGLRWSSWYWVFVIAPGAVFFMWTIFLGFQLSGYMKWIESFGVESMQDTVKLLQKSNDPLVLGLMAVAAVVAAPLCEEIVFRGFFYPVMKKFAGVWPAAISSALVFGAAHGNLAALLPLFLFGVLLVLIYEKTGSIWAPISVHFCFNAATVILQLAARFFDIPLDPPQ